MQTVLIDSVLLSDEAVGQRGVASRRGEVRHAGSCGGVGALCHAHQAQGDQSHQDGGLLGSCDGVGAPRHGLLGRDCRM